MGGILPRRIERRLRMGAERASAPAINSDCDISGSFASQVR